MLNILINFYLDKEQARKDVNVYALIYFLLGLFSFFVNLLQMVIFSNIGQTITQKIRYQTYGKMLRMPIPWFDNPKNNAGNLTSKLSADCKNVNGLITTFIAITLQNVTSLVAGIVIAFIFEWRTSLVALGLIPFMIIAGVVQMQFTTGFSDKSDAAYKESSQLIMESMMNIRTVSSFGYENVVFHKYEQKLKEPFELAIKKGNCSGLLFGFSQIVMFIIFALIFYIGTIFIRDNPGVTVNDVFTAIYAITFSAMTVGNNAHFLPDMASGKNAAASLFEILDSED
jgi:ATP-binding cassette subfamily B (MDR/TAP) protein 1